MIYSRLRNKCGNEQETIRKEEKTQEEKDEAYVLDGRVHWDMLYRAWGMYPPFCVRRNWFCVRGPPVSFISKTRNGGHRNARMDQNQNKIF